MSAPNLGKVLIVYYSRTGTTKQLGDYIHQRVGGDVVEIEPVTPYSDWYMIAVCAATKELMMKSVRPIKTHVENIAEYDTIFIGTPIWCWTAAGPVKTFLQEHNLEGKKVYPFSVWGGSGECTTYTDMQALAPKATFGEGYGCKQADLGKVQPEVNAWIDKISAQ